MDAWGLCVLIALVAVKLMTVGARSGGGGEGEEVTTCSLISFHQNYDVVWGFDHFSALHNDTQVGLTLDQLSGAGFESKGRYGSGIFGMKIKVTEKKSSGVLTAFYLSSKQSGHDEVDFEFLSGAGQPYTLSTNIFAKGTGGREQQFHLWFDPTADFHSYQLLWNQYQIVFFVDDTPIRVFKNNGSGNDTNPYPKVTQAMQVEGSIWDAEDWAGKVNWTEAPFTSSFRGFEIAACVSKDGVSAGECYSAADAWWNAETHQSLNVTQQQRYQYVKDHYVSYDYCTDRSRYPQPPPECLVQI